MVVSTRWVLNAMVNGEGKTVLRKAGVVEKGFTQVQKIDFQEVYLPVPWHVAMSLVNATSENQKHKRRLLEIKNAFLNVVLDEVVYVYQSDGFPQEGREHWAYQLKKAI